ncbi:MAG: HAD family phosphatase [Clostridia bacterium]|nr:HAD family phosphatase [Clostridia bacterium]
MIKNIILDIGDVLVKSNYQAFFQRKGLDRETANRVANATFFSPAWRELDRGVWPFERILDAFVENDPQDEEILRTVFQDAADFIVAYPYAESWIRSLQAEGLKVYCLSNLSDKIVSDCWKELAFLDLVDGRILSWEEKLIKPNPKIYRLLLDRYQLRAEESVFLDDSTANVEAAISVGLHGIVFQNQQQAAQEIERIKREAI